MLKCSKLCYCPVAPSTFSFKAPSYWASTHCKQVGQVAQRKSDSNLWTQDWIRDDCTFYKPNSSFSIHIHTFIISSEVWFTQTIKCNRYYLNKTNKQTQQNIQVWHLIASTGALYMMIVVLCSWPQISHFVVRFNFSFLYVVIKAPAWEDIW